MYKTLFFKMLVFTYLLNSCQSFAQQPVNLEVNEFEKAIVEPGVQVLDVRTFEEYQGGHLRDALLADWTKKEQFKQRVAALDKSKPVYTYCLSGGRSSAAAEYLRENGFTTYNMTGGISKWKQEGKPVEAEKKIKQMTMKEFRAMIPNDRAVLVDVSAKWCPPCKKMSPVIDSLSKANSGRFNLVIVDGGSETGLASDLKVDAFPTFIVYKNGLETWRGSGVMEAAELLKHL